MDLVALRAQRHAALGDPTRLAIVDELASSDRFPFELQRLNQVPSNLLAHHFDVLEQVGLITRSRSSGDGRRRYVHLHRDALDGLLPGRRRSPEPALFVCTHNSARSQLAAAPVDPAHRTVGGKRRHPPGRTRASRRRSRRTSGRARPQRRPSLLLDDVLDRPAMVVTVCEPTKSSIPTRPGCIGPFPTRWRRRAGWPSMPLSPSCATGSRTSSPGHEKLDRQPETGTGRLQLDLTGVWSPKRSAPVCLSSPSSARGSWPPASRPTTSASSCWRTRPRPPGP